MKIEFVYFMVLWMNAFPVKSGIPKMISPCELLLQFYCIHTGRVLKRHSFMPMPMPDHVI
jgi:hypothetical protein